MSLFFVILLKVFPIYINVVLGFLSSKLLNVQRESIATLLIYILGPIVVFSATLSVKIDFAVAILPIFLFIFCSIIAFVFFSYFSKLLERPNRKYPFIFSRNRKYRLLWNSFSNNLVSTISSWYLYFYSFSFFVIWKYNRFLCNSKR